MKAAHLENEINPFASVFCAPYAWSSRKGHGLRSLLLLLEMSIDRGRLEKYPTKQAHYGGAFKVRKGQTDRLPFCAALKLHRAERIA